MRATLEQAAADVVVAGHLCVDVIVPFSTGAKIPGPGELSVVGSPAISTGGAVANTGVALHRLGTAVRLVARVGDDLFGRAAIDVLNEIDPQLTSGIQTVPGETTSYTIVVNVPGVDRSFMHCPGANHSFSAETDIPDKCFSGAKLLHFGYPPLMRGTYIDSGQALADAFRRAKSAGLYTSLDMAMPDQAGESGAVDWQSWLARVLPHVDFFLPSLDEMNQVLPSSDHRDAPEMAKQLLDFGCAVIGLKLGHRGLYLQSRAGTEPTDTGLPAGWSSRQLWRPCFQTPVVGTTGSGDCTIAGLLAALVSDEPVEVAMKLATGTGAFSVQAADATSGVPHIDTVRRRIAAGWEPLDVTVPYGWTWNERASLFVGPKDRAAKSSFGFKPTASDL